MKTIDCRGLNCPEPVLRTKNALAEQAAASLNVIVDNETARENVIRFAHSRGNKADWQEKDGAFYISITGGTAETAQSNLSCPAVDLNHQISPVLFIATDRLGQGSSELGQLLMRNFIYTLTKRDNLPRAIILMNSGVKLSVSGSPVIEELEYLQSQDVQILVCGTCLDYYELKEEHKAGQVSNMYAIADFLFAADKVITV